MKHGKTSTPGPRPESGLGYHLLLGFLLLMFLMGPLFREDIGGIKIGRFLFVGIIVGSIITVGRTRGPAGVALALGLPALWLGLTQDPLIPERGLWAVGFVCAFLTFLTGLILVRVNSHRIVTSTTVSGSLCAYLLMGVIWSYLYQLLDAWEPESFRGLTPVTPLPLDEASQGLASQAPLDDALLATWAAESELRESEIRYFSFVTLTTLGYGDITPRSPAARSLASLEAITGQLFLIVAVARLVGMQVGHALTGKSDKSRSA